MSKTIGNLEVAIIALFASSIIVLKWNIASRLKSLFSISPTKRLKPFDCLPCMTWWIAIITSLFFVIFDGVKPFDALLACMLSFVVAIKIER